jgi:hypothetical protein
MGALAPTASFAPNLFRGDAQNRKPLRHRQNDSFT